MPADMYTYIAKTYALHGPGPWPGPRAQQGAARGPARGRPGSTPLGAEFYRICVRFYVNGRGRPPPGLCDKLGTHTDLAEDPAPPCVTVKDNIWIYTNLYNIDLC